jgi:hypothetical protein
MRMCKKKKKKKPGEIVINRVDMDISRILIKKKKKTKGVQMKDFEEAKQMVIGCFLLY